MNGVIYPANPATITAPAFVASPLGTNYLNLVSPQLSASVDQASIQLADGVPPIITVSGNVQQDGQVALNAPSSPSVPATCALAYYGTSAGHLGYVSDDGNSYLAGAARLQIAAQTVTGTTTLASLPTGVAAGTYDVEGWVMYRGAAAAGTAQFQLVSTATFSLDVVSFEFLTAAYTQPACINFNTVTTSPTLTTTNVVMRLNGSCVVTAAGSLSLQCGLGTPGDNVVIVDGWLHVKPAS